MNVLFTSPALFGPDGVYGGGERYARELARAVAETLGGATLFAAATHPVERRDGPLRVVARPPWHWVRGQRFNPLPRGLLREIRRADVVHCFQHHIVQTSLAMLAGRALRRPVVVTDLGGGGWDISAWINTGRWATAFLHLSEYARQMAGRGSCRDDAVLYGGAGSVPGRSGEGRTVLFVGRLLPHKGPDVLIEAARPSWQVRLVGSALDQRYLSDLNRLAEGKSVRFDHGADDAALEAAYQSAAVVVVPSLPRDRYGAVTPVAELLGLVAIEAGARGIPVVASNTASLPEIVVDGVTGFLVPPGDVGALRERVDAVLSDEPLRRRLGEAARRHVTERFSWRAAAAVAIDTYRRICSQ